MTEAQFEPTLTCALAAPTLMATAFAAIRAPYQLKRRNKEKTDEINRNALVYQYSCGIKDQV